MIIQQNLDVLESVLKRRYPLVICYVAEMAIEIVDLPINDGDFPVCYVNFTRGYPHLDLFELRKVYELIFTLWQTNIAMENSPIDDLFYLFKMVIFP